MAYFQYRNPQMTANTGRKLMSTVNAPASATSLFKKTGTKISTPVTATDAAKVDAGVPAQNLPISSGTRKGAPNTKAGGLSGGSPQNTRTISAREALSGALLGNPSTMQALGLVTSPAMSLATMNPYGLASTAMYVGRLKNLQGSILDDFSDEAVKEMAETGQMTVADARAVLDNAYNARQQTAKNALEKFGPSLAQGLVEGSPAAALSGMLKGLTSPGQRFEQSRLERALESQLRELGALGPLSDSALEALKGTMVNLGMRSLLPGLYDDEMAGFGENPAKESYGFNPSGVSGLTYGTGPFAQGGLADMGSAESRGFSPMQGSTPGYTALGPTATGSALGDFLGSIGYSGLAQSLTSLQNTINSAFGISSGLDSGRGGAGGSGSAPGVTGIGGARLGGAAGVESMLSRNWGGSGISSASGKAGSGGSGKSGGGSGGVGGGPGGTGYGGGKGGGKAVD